ncbi:hypothetical protein [Nocardia australiensis]|uniref:hypothetical protein n=1 Tax=Nocardia australiensis TaxID=2887191 RepID=UPI001D14C342|nr:hypothetical protein [Nocardia australiensis]
MRSLRTLTGLRRRAASTPATTETVAPAAIDPNVDPPIVAALVAPLLELRSSLGTGVATPDRAITGALSAASTQVADTEGSHRDGLHALESTWESTGADAAVPALRTTQTQIGDISDRGPAYLSVLGDAHATSARAANKVDQIIADFRRDAREIMGNASSAPDTDAVIARGTLALRDAVTTVTAARSDMDDHTRRLDEMGPLTVTTPSGITSNQSSFGTNGQYQPGINGQYPPAVANPGVTGQPVDPVLAAQLQLQQQLISAGVSLGTSAISAGVDIGTHLIDKIAEVGTHAMDTVAASTDKAMDTAIPELIHPGSTTGGANSGGASGGTSTSPGGLFDFGGGTNKPSPQGTGPGTVIPPAQNGSANSDTPDVRPVPTPAPAPAAEPEPPKPAAPQAAGQPGVTGGMAMPPSAGTGEKPRGGQLGVTVPTATENLTETVPAAVIGDFGDDTL